MAIERQDAWSPAFVLTTAASTVIFVLIAQINFGGALLAILLAFLSLFVIFVWFCSDLWRWRLRHALSIVVAVVVAFGIVYHAPFLVQGEDKAAFYSRQAEFERQVEDARAKRTQQGPLQVVVDYEDQSVFVTANSFYYVIYDETDGAGPYEENSWPYAKSPTGVIAMKVPDKMQHLAGHFYSFRTSY